MSSAPGRRLLLVHAHPDDESITTGATMARYAAEGARVTLVTCTLGEEGEVIPPELAHLAPDPAGRPGPDGLTPLAAYRRGELAAAMRELGVTDHRLLGGAGRYRDSGMMGAPTNDRPGCFWQAPLDEAASHLVPVVREVRPQVLVAYDPNGGYGHPDHIKAHRVALRAAELAADPTVLPAAGAPHTIERIYYPCVPRTVLAGAFARLHEAHAAGRPGAPGGTPFPFPAVGAPEDVPGVVPDESAVDVVVDGTRHAAAKTAAMRAHATQITVAGGDFALSNGLGQPLLATEYFRLAGAGERARDAASRPAADLFEGVRA